MASAAPQALGERDWSNLTAGPAGAIAERVLSNDYVDLLRFRAVCRAWRAGSAHLRARGALDRRFHPRRWVLLPCAFASLPRRLFLNVVTGEPVVLVLPDLPATSRGTPPRALLVLCRMGTHAVQLLNPLTGQLADLPHAASLLGSSGDLLRRQLRNLELRGAGLADDSMVALNFRSSSLSPKPGDLLWTRLTFHDGIISALPFQGRTCLVNSKNISVVGTAASQQHPPRRAAAAVHGRGAQAYLKNRMFLADNDGELILCYHVLPTNEPCNHRRCSVCRVKLDSRDMASLAMLQGKALFTGTRRAVLVSAAVSSSIDADTVYVCSYNDVAH
ncbi:LOW QUALITY PROTEIN: hypothetical protein PAHAL_2G419400 [Panicum hallii]|uniref:KIB1-4 beta-propeller domain-containing protein n=1 Tax=Panicum hallii TaxID=206008 RepID=A0A2S3H3E7_9POAL|nr:LOW QUALITY PROTEIN: hypothetical protein PAHAL_2G419400 [Panicum hallii]